MSGSLGPYGSWVIGSSTFCCWGTAPEVVAKFEKKEFGGVVVEGALLLKEKDVGVVAGVPPKENVVFGAVLVFPPKVKPVEGEVVAVELGVVKEPKELVVGFWGVVENENVLGDVFAAVLNPVPVEVVPKRGVVVVGAVNPENPEKDGVVVVEVPKDGVDVVPNADGVVEVEFPKLNAGVVVVVVLVFPNENALLVEPVVLADGAKLEKENAELGVEDGWPNWEVVVVGGVEKENALFVLPVEKDVPRDVVLVEPGVPVAFCW
jgi:hypothetical protein